MKTFKHWVRASILGFVVCQSMFAMVGTDTLTMYALPSIDAKAVGALHAPKTIHIVDSGWVYVTYPKTKQSGWVKRDALQQWIAKSQNIEVVQKTVGLGPGMTEIVAYKHASDLSDAESKRIIRRVRAHQQKWMKEMTQTMQHLQNMTDAFWFDDTLTPSKSIKQDK